MPKKQFRSTDTEAPIVTEKSAGIPLVIKIGVVVIVLLVLAVAGAAAYHYYTFQQKVNAQIAPPSEPKALIEQVGKLMELPLNEEPTIATVSDVEKLKDQPFFASAQNGDKVLIYQKAKKAILYRPSTQKIVEVGPVNIDPNQTAASESAKTTPDAKPSTKPTVKPSAAATNTIDIAVYNGTKRSGLARNAQTKLKEGYATGSVVATGNSSDDYKETIIIDMTKKNTAAAQAIAKVVGGKVGAFPKGESSPSAEILIILGDNYKTE